MKKEKAQEELVSRDEGMAKQGKGKMGKGEKQTEASKELRKAQRTYCISRKVSRLWIDHSHKQTNILSYLPYPKLLLKCYLSEKPSMTAIYK